MAKLVENKLIKFLNRIVKIIGEYLRSIRLKVFAVMIIVGFVPIFLIGKLNMITVENNMINDKKDILNKQYSVIISHIIAENYLGDQSSKNISAELSQLSLMYKGRIILVDSNFVVVNDSFKIDTGKTSVSQDILKVFKGNKITRYNKEKHSLKLDIPIVLESGEIIGVFEGEFSTMDVENTLRNMEGKTVFIQSILCIAITMFSFFWVMFFVRPFNKIKELFDKTASGYLDNRMSETGYTELNDIAGAYNALLDRMSELDETRQEFVSNVSHELKTPITSIKVLADSLLMQDNVPAEIYKEFFTDICEEINRENEIITDLLTLVRMDKKTGINIEKIDMNELMEMILKRLRPIAAKKNVELVLESHRDVVAEVDKVKITSAISNLVENAIKYNNDDGWVRVKLNADYKYFYVVVADSGIGIPEESQKLIFERFYRVDKARARKTGGTGLGLAITKTTILLHNGDISIKSKEGEGTTFTVKVPLLYNENGNNNNIERK